MSHRNARLTLHGRRILVDRVCSGRPIAHVAKEMGISRPTAYKCLRRWRAEGEPGLYDRSSRPYATPLRTPPAREEEVCALRRSHKLGPARIGPILGMPASTVHRVLVRHGLNRLAFMDRPTGQVIRPYRPQTNGKVERFNRTLLDEWAYLRPYTSNSERSAALTDFLDTYNHHRCHTALAGKPPISRANNASGQYT
ncbi:leucine zipper domain-containing protein [Streptomyces sp. NPDC048641]|uniref:integrase core domain-containing protein n=1 Tax=Streptomyces sp. NPDC048641 TaxID=3154825 RepID=UPI003424A870